MQEVSQRDLRRWAYLHEAGHATVAYAVGLRVAGLHSDGEQGACDMRLSPVQEEKIAQIEHRWRSKEIDGATYATTGLQVWDGWLAALLGGIMGEALDHANPIHATRRAGDDLPSFFQIIVGLTSGLPKADADALAQQAYLRAHEIAAREVAKAADVTRKLAQALEAAGSLKEDEISTILAAVPGPSSPSLAPKR